MSNKYPNVITIDNIETAKKYFLMPPIQDILPKSVSIEIGQASGSCSMGNCGLYGITGPRHKLTRVVLNVEGQTDKLQALRVIPASAQFSPQPPLVNMAKEIGGISTIGWASPQYTKEQEFQFLHDNYDFVMSYLASYWSGICWFSDSTPEGDPLNNPTTKIYPQYYSAYRLAKWIKDKTPEFGIIHASAPVINPVHSNPDERLSVIQSYVWVTAKAMKFAFKDPNRKLGGWNKYLGDIPSYLVGVDQAKYSKKLENIFKNIIK